MITEELRTAIWEHETSCNRVFDCPVCDAIQHVFEEAYSKERRVRKWINNRRARWSIGIIAWTIQRLCSDEFRLDIAEWAYEFMKLEVTHERDRTRRAKQRA